MLPGKARSVKLILLGGQFIIAFYPPRVICLLLAELGILGVAAVHMKSHILTVIQVCRAIQSCLIPVFPESQILQIAKRICDRSLIAHDRIYKR